MLPALPERAEFALRVDERGFAVVGRDYSGLMHGFMALILNIEYVDRQLLLRSAESVSHYMVERRMIHFCVFPETDLFFIKKAVGAAAAFQKVLAQNGIESSLTDGLRYMGALFVVIGHNYPVFFGFKGGKGIATSGAVMFMLDWRAGLVVLIGAIAVMVITRYVSLGSMVGAVLYVAAPLFFNIAVDKKLNYWFIIVSVILAALAVYRHKKNIVRLIHGTESKVGKSKKPEKN